MGDAHGNLRLAEECNDDAVMADTLDFAFNAHEGALHDTDTTMLLTEEVTPGQGNALLIGIGQRLGLDEVLHLTVGNVDNLGSFGIVEGGFGDELQVLADLILPLEQLDTAFHGMDEDEVVDGREHLMLQLVVVSYFLMLHVEIGGDVLTTELIAHLHGALGIAKTNAEGIPADEGVVGFFDDKGRSACVGDTGCLHRFYHRFAHHLCLTQQHA